MYERTLTITNVGGTWMADGVVAGDADAVGEMLEPCLWPFIAPLLKEGKTFKIIVRAE